MPAIAHLVVTLPPLRGPAGVVARVGATGTLAVAKSGSLVRSGSSGRGG